MKNKLAFFIILIFTISLFGCNDNKGFHSAYEQFWDSYYKATDFYDLDEHRLDALKKMDPNSVETELKNMENALNTLSDNMKTDSEKEVYSDLENDYDELKYLLSIYNKYDALSDDEKMDVEDKLVIVFINRSSLEENKDN